VLAQSALQVPRAATSNTALLATGTWSERDVTVAGIRDLFGGPAERTTTYFGAALSSLKDGDYDFVSDEVVPYDPSTARHQVFMPAGAAGSMGTRGGERRYVSGPGGDTVRDIDVSYSLGFRCAFPAMLP
jgi:hypothetical protein